MPKLYVVTHSAVNIDYSLPAERWTLSPEGLQLMMPIAECTIWSKVRKIYHSPEQRAAQTAMIIARRWDMPLATNRGLRELEVRSSVMDCQQFHDVVGEHLEGKAQHPFIEGIESALGRFTKSIAQIIATHPGQSIGIVSHAKILTVFYGQLMRRNLTRSEWQSLRLPDLSVIDLSSWRVESGFFSKL